ncbi:MAG: molybdate ABC transporter substrate-binding protein [Verrucomicrobiota bacterium]
MARRLIAAAVLVGVLAAPAAARERAPKLTIFAAASLTGAFQAFDSSETYSFAGSNTLAAQIRQGARADVFASASPRYTQDLFRAGLVEKPVTFATNRLVLIVPRSNPAGLSSVYDLGRKNVKLVVAAPAVPVGSYTRTVLRRLGLSSVLTKVVSQESDVKGVVGKVVLGQADAGFVYVTDVKPVARDVASIRIPAWAQPRLRYEIAVVRSSSQKTAARAWVARIRGKAGRAALARAGFGQP